MTILLLHICCCIFGFWLGSELYYYINRPRR